MEGICGVDFVYVGCEAAMKSDEEFIAGIYRKAEEKRKEEEKNIGRGQRTFAWRALAAAACLCLIVSGVVYAGSRGKTPQNNPDSEQNVVMALSLVDTESGDGEKTPRTRMTEGEGQRGEMTRANGVSIYPDGQNAAADALLAGYSFAHSLMEQTKDNSNIQESGGN